MVTVLFRLDEKYEFEMFGITKIEDDLITCLDLELLYDATENSVDSEILDGDVYEMEFKRGNPHNSESWEWVSTKNVTLKEIQEQL